MTDLDHLSAIISAVESTPVPEEDTPDWVGRLRWAGRRLYAKAKDLLAETEVPAGTQLLGLEYMLVAGRKAERAYNTQRILADVGRKLNLGLFDVLRLLMREDVVSLSFKWTNLKRFFATHRIKFEIAGDDYPGGEVATLEDPHVIERWTTEVTVQGVENE